MAWTSYGNQKQYCKFQANVLLSSSENAEYLKNPNATTHFKTVDNEFMKSVQEKQKQFEKEYEMFVCRIKLLKIIKSERIYTHFGLN